MQYDIEALREELKDYYGTAVYVMSQVDEEVGLPYALAELVAVDNLTDEQVISLAKENGLI